MHELICSYFRNLECVPIFQSGKQFTPNPNSFIYIYIYLMYIIHICIYLHVYYILHILSMIYSVYYICMYIIYILYYILFPISIHLLLCSTYNRSKTVSELMHTLIKSWGFLAVTSHLTPPPANTPKLRTYIVNTLFMLLDYLHPPSPTTMGFCY